MHSRKILAGAAVAGVFVLGAGGVAVASGGGTGEVSAPEAPQGGMAHEGPGYGPGGKHGEKIAEMEQLLQYDEIGMDQAEQIATGQAPGEVVEIKLKEEEGYAVYEVETFANSTLTEFYINAQDGTILEQKIEGAEESGPMAQDEDAEMPEGPLDDDDDHDDDHDEDRDDDRGPEALPDTSGEVQD